MLNKQRGSETAKKLAWGELVVSITFIITPMGDFSVIDLARRGTDRVPSTRSNRYGGHFPLVIKSRSIPPDEGENHLASWKGNRREERNSVNINQTNYG